MILEINEELYMFTCAEQSYLDMNKNKVIYEPVTYIFDLDTFLVYPSETEEAKSVNRAIVFPSVTRAEAQKAYIKSLNNKKLDYILFLYPRNSYKLVARGAIFDAFKFGKPVIALKNDYFNYLVSKGQKFGYFFDTIDELKSFFHALPSVDSAEYNEFSKNSKNMLSFFSPKIVSEQLQEQI